VRAAPFAALLTAGCLVHRAHDGPRLPPTARFGLDRTAVAYDDPRAADKHVLLERINRDRVIAGAPPLRYETRASLVGDLFCLDAALGGFWGHWDRQGRPPYVRWGLAGGLDFHAENAAAVSSTAGLIERSTLDLLLDSHQAMMNEQPPDDGHRRTILDPRFTHVGIGVAVAGGHFRMTEEFTRVVFDWMDVPATPLSAGALATFAGRPQPGWEVGMIEIRHEPPPEPLSLLQLRRRGSYGYPQVVRTFRRPTDGMPSDGNDLRADHTGAVSVRFPLSDGPGYYFVLCFVAPRLRPGEELAPATAAMVAALP
jgi:uncharacterized protein YkwD